MTDNAVNCHDVEAVAYDDTDMDRVQLHVGDASLAIILDHHNPGDLNAAARVFAEISKIAAEAEDVLLTQADTLCPDCHDYGVVGGHYYDEKPCPNPGCVAR